MSPTGFTEVRATVPREDDGNPDIAPYHQDLNGVNQPANICFAYLLWATFVIVAVIVAICRLRRTLSARKRRTRPTNQPARLHHWLRPFLKRHLIHAPLFSQRRARSIWLWGTLPTRLQTLIIGLYFISNVAYILAVNLDNPVKYAILAEIRGRTGTLAAANLVPLVLFAGRNNPLVHILGISYDTYVLLHRWVGRMMVLESIVHAASWAVVMVADKGWPGLGQEVLHDHFISVGFTGLTCVVFIFCLSLRPIRKMFYEAFVLIHIVLAATVIVCALVHCKLSGFDLPQTPWVIVAIALWGTERIIRVIRVVFGALTRRGWEAMASIEALNGETPVCRVTMSLPRRIAIPPAAFAYIRIGEVRPWETHPFSIAWSENGLGSKRVSTESVVEMGQGGSQSSLGTTSVLSVADGSSPRNTSSSGKGPGVDTSSGRTTVSFIIAAQTGFTKALFDAAAAQAERGLTLQSRCSFEGPYDGFASFEDYEHVLLVTGGTGITHMLGTARRLLSAEGDDRATIMRVSLVWIVRDMEALEWVEDWLQDMMDLPSSVGKFSVKLFVTRPRAGQPQICEPNGNCGKGSATTSETSLASSQTNTEKQSPRSPSRPNPILPTLRNLEIQDGRPNIDRVVDGELALNLGNVAIVACGPGAMTDNVREAARRVQDVRRRVDYHEASFGW